MRPQPEFHERDRADGVAVEEIANHIRLGKRVELPLDLVEERGVLALSVDVGVPFAAAGICDGDGEVLEVVGEALLPLDGCAHFDAAGGEEGEVAVDGGAGGHAVAELGVLFERRVGRGDELVVFVWDNGV